jgi:hypothetical protein
MKNTRKRPGTKTAKKKKHATISRISEKLDRLEEKVDVIRKGQEETEEDVEDTLEAEEKVEKEVHVIDKEIHKVENEMHKMEEGIEKVEESVLNIGKFTMGREHFMELARGTAGAFLGVGIGMSIKDIPELAAGLGWNNILGIFAFIMVVGAILIYKNEKQWIEKEGKFFVVKRLVVLFIICICVEALALYIFNTMPLEMNLILKTLIVGSYPAMSGAITFTIA